MVFDLIVISSFLGNAKTGGNYGKGQKPGTLSGLIFIDLNKKSTTKKGEKFPFLEIPVVLETTLDRDIFNIFFLVYPSECHIICCDARMMMARITNSPMLPASSA